MKCQSSADVWAVQAAPSQPISRQQERWLRQRPPNRRERKQAGVAGVAPDAGGVVVAAAGRVALHVAARKRVQLLRDAGRLARPEPLAPVESRLDWPRDEDFKMRKCALPERHLRQRRPLPLKLRRQPRRIRPRLRLTMPETKLFW